MAAWPARLLGTGILFDLHEAMPELFRASASHGPLVAALLGRVETAAIRFADGAVAVSEPCLARAIARGAPEALHRGAECLTPDAFWFVRLPHCHPPAAHREPRTVVARYGFDILLRPSPFWPDVPVARTCAWRSWVRGKRGRDSSVGLRSWA
jgi:hypothetical protein